MSLVEPAVKAITPGLMTESLLPEVVSYVTSAAWPEVFAATETVPFWVMTLFEVKSMLPPLEKLVIFPFWMMPAAPPAVVLLPMTLRLPPPARTLSLPMETGAIVVVLRLLPMTVTDWPLRP